MSSSEQIWKWDDFEKAIIAKDNLSMRHPGNLTDWSEDGMTVKLEGVIHNQTELVLKQSGAKRID